MKTLNVMPAMREWWAAQNVEQANRDQERRKQIASLPKTKTPCSADELAAIAAISPGRVTYIPGIPTKRFARQIQGATELTERQRIYLWGIVWKFRRQIGDQKLVRMAQQLAGGH